ncbi:MAG: hypothetical protein QM765_03510 [Myxococcales bacterium]
MDGKLVGDDRIRQLDLLLPRPVDGEVDRQVATADEQDDAHRAHAGQLEQAAASALAVHRLAGDLDAQLGLRLGQVDAELLDGGQRLELGLQVEGRNWSVLVDVAGEEQLHQLREGNRPQQQVALLEEPTTACGADVDAEPVRRHRHLLELRFRSPMRPPSATSASHDSECALGWESICVRPA